MSARRSRSAPGFRALLLLGAVACAGPARPPVMARVAEVRTSPASVDAATWAPQAHAHALGLEERAERALQDGDADSAALLAEHALAAHEHAWVLARLARAERRRLEAQAELDEQRRTLEQLRAEHERLAAEAAGLELRAQAARGARPLPAGESAAEARQTRRRAAAALASQARLLCVGARLLGATQRVQPLLARLDELERQGGSGEGTSVEGAAALRSECLRVISDVRRDNAAPAARAASPASTTPAAARPLPADALLDELGASGVAPSRDDRGVSVALHDVLGPDGRVSEAARAELRGLAQVARAHPEFPLLLIGHSGATDADAAAARELEAVRSELAGGGVAAIEVQAVGDRQPLIPPGTAAARRRNQRVELVFVAPSF